MMCEQYTESLPEDFYLNWIIKDGDCFEFKFNPLPEISTEWTLQYKITSEDEKATVSLVLNGPLKDENIPKNLQVKISVFLQNGHGVSLIKSVQKLKCFDIDQIPLAILGMSSMEEDFDIPGGYFVLQCHFQFSIQNNSPDICYHAEVNQSLLDLSSDLKSILNEGTFSDVQINVGKDMFQAHKSILCARSLGFKILYENFSPETLSVTLSDAESKSYGNFMKYLYTGVIEDRKPEAVLTFYTLAHRYKVQSLQKECREILASTMTIHNASDVLKSASKYSDEELAEKAKNFLSNKMLTNVVFPKFV